jgi:photoactive yellow protein
MGLVPVEDLRSLSPEEAECLPIGFIGLDEEGYVLRYNSYEAKTSGLSPQSVLGRHFFRDVAPCASVKAFEGRYARMVRRRLPAAESSRYLFCFNGGERLVKVFLSYQPNKGEGLVILRELGHL